MARLKLNVEYDMPTSVQPFLIRAYHEWLTHNRLTPYILVDTRVPHVHVPEQYIQQDGKIIFNLSNLAIHGLKITNQFIEFNASFGNQPFSVAVPIRSVLAIYAKENPSYGTQFTIDENNDGDDDDTPSNLDNPPPHSKKPKLSIVK
jgi:stringent starvation protein B